MAVSEWTQHDMRMRAVREIRLICREEGMTPADLLEAWSLQIQSEMGEASEELKQLQGLKGKV